MNSSLRFVAPALTAAVIAACAVAAGLAVKEQQQVHAANAARAAAPQVVQLERVVVTAAKAAPQVVQLQKVVITASRTPIGIAIATQAIVGAAA
jgi:hypothetical protein